MPYSSEDIPRPTSIPNVFIRFIERIVEVRGDEISALLLACAYFFFLLASYYILRPIRDEMGVAGDVQNLAWLFTGTLLATLIANPLFARRAIACEKIYTNHLSVLHGEFNHLLSAVDVRQ